MSKQEESSAEVKGLAFACSIDRLTVKGLEAECLGTYTSVDVVVGIQEARMI